MRVIVLGLRSSPHCAPSTGGPSREKGLYSRLARSPLLAPPLRSRQKHLRNSPGPISDPVQEAELRSHRPDTSLGREGDSVSRSGRNTPSSRRGEVPVQFFESLTKLLPMNNCLVNCVRDTLYPFLV